MGRGAELVDGSRPDIGGRGGPGDALADQWGIVTRGQCDGARQQAAVLQGFDPQPGGVSPGGSLDRRRPVGRDFRERMGERNHMVVSFAGVVCDRMTTALSARRPSAGAVPGRWGACLAVRTPPAAFASSGSEVRSQQSRDRFLTSDRDYRRPEFTVRPSSSPPMTRPTSCGHAGQRADAAVGQADLHAAGVSRRGPGRIAVAQKRSGLDLEFRPRGRWHRERRGSPEPRIANPGWNALAGSFMGGGCQGNSRATCSTPTPCRRPGTPAAWSCWCSGHISRHGESCSKCRR